MSSIQFNPEAVPISGSGPSSFDSIKSSESMPSRLQEKPASNREECIARFAEKTREDSIKNTKFCCTAVGALIGASLGAFAGPVGIVVGMAVGALLGYAIAAIVNKEAEATLSPEDKLDNAKQNFKHELISTLSWAKSGAAQQNTGRILECMEKLDKMTKGDDSFKELRELFHDFVKEGMHSGNPSDYKIFQNRLQNLMDDIKF